MIYDTLNNLPNYLGMSDNLDAVIEFVMARAVGFGFLPLCAKRITSIRINFLSLKIFIQKTAI